MDERKNKYRDEMEKIMDVVKEDNNLMKIIESVENYSEEESVIPLPFGSDLSTFPKWKYKK